MDTCLEPNAGLVVIEVIGGCYINHLIDAFRVNRPHIASGIGDDPNFE
ncbi:unannotated protein [freshwater metagenome]|uniref:Unannotated protein n=1 Tax=freshwater metagenome TaxID=449393 RepID=A0A6J6Q977_9ZZZZ